jgi:hypothetical protein
MPVGPKGGAKHVGAHTISVHLHTHTHTHAHTHTHSHPGVQSLVSYVCAVQGERSLVQPLRNAHELLPGDVFVFVCACVCLCVSMSVCISVYVY